MQQIPLSQDQVALVDDEEFARLSQFHWCYRAERNGRQGYAVRHHKVEGKDRLLYLHREILPAPAGFETLFLNHDRLDCRRENLKLATKEEARRHHRVRVDSKSGVKGVRFNPANESWSAYVYRNGRAYHIATHYSQQQAAAAYEDALWRENPGLHNAPKRVERPRNPARVQQDNPEEGYVGEGQ